jgi:aminotransferase
MELPVSFYSDLATEYEVKRDLMCSALADAGLTPSIPAGAYYVLADVSSLPGATAKEKARTLLRERGVAAVAGTAFFTDGRGDNLLRFCFAKRDEELKRACDLLRGTVRV